MRNAAQKEKQTSAPATNGVGPGPAEPANTVPANLTLESLEARMMAYHNVHKDLLETIWENMRELEAKVDQTLAQQQTAPNPSDRATELMMIRLEREEALERFTHHFSHPVPSTRAAQLKPLLSAVTNLSGRHFQAHP